MKSQPWQIQTRKLWSCKERLPRSLKLSISGRALEEILRRSHCFTLIWEKRKSTFVYLSCFIICFGLEIYILLLRSWSHWNCASILQLQHNSTPVSQNRQTQNWAAKKLLHPTMRAGLGNDDYSLSVNREMLYFSRKRNLDSISSLSRLSYYGQGTGLSGISSVGRGPIS